MKGYWYIPALAAVTSVLSTIFESVLLIIVLLFWLCYLSKTKRLGTIPIIISLTTFLFFYLYLPQIEWEQSISSEEQIKLQGNIISPIKSSDSLLQFDFQEKESKIKIKINYFNPDISRSDFSTIKYGASCQMEGIIASPETSTNPGQFNYQKYLATSGIHYEMKIESMDDIVCHGDKNQNYLYTLRESIKQYIASTYSDKSSVWINALVLGDDSGISDDTIDLFQRWGLSHILAISGLHIGLVVGLLYFVLVRLNVLTKEKAQFIMIIFLPLYAVLAGGEPSVLRATLMVLFVIFIQKIKIKLSTTDIISITFLSLLLVDKYIIYHVGFQLSFMVSFGIILSKNWLLDSHSLFFQMLKISFISQLMIVPLQIIYFYNLNPFSIVLNVLVVPYFTFFVIPFMFLLVIVSLIPLISELLDQLFMMVHDFIFLKPLLVIDEVAYYPWITGKFPSLLIAFYYVLLVAMMSMIQRKKNWQGLFYGITLTILLLSLVVQPYTSPYGTVTMLDIGQGDAFVIELPYRKGVIIVDASANFTFEDMEPSDTVYEKIIKPYLHYRGITKIDAIFITHEDIDHAGSVNFILTEFDVEMIVVSDFYQFDKKLEESIGQKKVEVLKVADGQSLDIKGKMFTFLSPRVDKKSNNENSLVFQTKFGQSSWLFTGDIDKNIEHDILHKYPNLSTDILKVAHHGSNTSTDSFFIKQIKPTYALISVGKNNRYGHPSSDVIDLFEKEKISILRTDQHGAVIYRFNEEAGTFYQFQP